MLNYVNRKEIFLAQLTPIMEDRNFLDYPNWIVTKRDHPQDNSLTIYKEIGCYTITSTTFLPGRFDKMVLYFLLNTLHNEGDIKHGQVTTTRYMIAQNTLEQNQNFSKKTYMRIMDAIDRWQAITIQFDGTFYKDGIYTSKQFTIIDWHTLDTQTGDLVVQFNDTYLNQLQSSTYFCPISYTVYRQLKRPLSARMYEILISACYNHNIWCVEANDLGQRLTLKKSKYPSQIMDAIQPAVTEVNTKTRFYIDWKYDKQYRFFIIQVTRTVH